MWRPDADGAGAGRPLALSVESGVRVGPALSKGTDCGVGRSPGPTFFDHPHSQALLEPAVLTAIPAPLVHWAVFIC